MILAALGLSFHHEECQCKSLFEARVFREPVVRVRKYAEFGRAGPNNGEQSAAGQGNVR